MRICEVCNERPALKSGKDKEGNQKWQNICGRCRLKRDGWKKHMSYDRRYAYKKFVGMTCKLCGFEAANRCQMDGHHIDHDHSNNAEDNIQTLCSNCHRLLHFTTKNPPT